MVPVRQQEARCGRWVVPQPTGYVVVAIAQSVSGVYTYITAMAAREIWQDSSRKPNKEGGGRCGSAEGPLPAAVWPSKSQ